MQVPQEDRPILGLIPCGTANDLARALGIPNDIQAAVQMALAGPTRRIDIVRASDSVGHETYVVNAISGGLSVKINEILDKQTKQWWKRLAYSRAAMEAFGDTPTHRVRIQTDDDNFQRDVFGLIITTSGHVGGYCMIPQTDLTNGRMELATIPQLEPLDAMQLLVDFAMGKQLESPHVQWCSTSHIEIESKPPMDLIVDGDPVEPRLSSFDIVPAAICVASDTSAPT